MPQTIKEISKVAKMSSKRCGNCGASGRLGLLMVSRYNSCFCAVNRACSNEVTAASSSFCARSWLTLKRSYSVSLLANDCFDPVTLAFSALISPCRDCMELFSTGNCGFFGAWARMASSCVLWVMSWSCSLETMPSCRADCAGGLKTA